MLMDNVPNSDLWKPKRAAAFLGISPISLRRLVDNGLLPAVKIPAADGGKRYWLRFREVDLQAFAEKYRTEVQ